MKNLFILFLLFTTVNSFSQCKYKTEDKNNKETKKITLFTNTKNLMWGVLAKEEDAYFVKLQIKRPKAFSIKGGADITFVMASDTVVIVNEKTQLPVRGITNEVNVKIPITKEQLIVLSTNDVQEMKVISSDGHFEEELNDSRAKKLKANVNCILE